ncbi:aminotransferase class I/II-fold pyridoxal phosphate-dependent enzyme [Desulfothermobacter acidiphilus]|uniref:methionine gamma-lyase family protein n=1 Tax=Desulfothermobacter acidiphilus TaxID=1938353 RepID=UPI003F8BB39F
MSNNEHLTALVREVEAEVAALWRRIDLLALTNQERVLNSFRSVRLSSYHLSGSTGYGYGDAGREALEAAYASVFGAEAALVRPQIVSGTQAVAICLFALLRPGDLLLFLQGSPYDTLREVIEGEGKGSLLDWGVRYNGVDACPGGVPDWDSVEAILRAQRPRVVLLQRSGGYAWRRGLTLKVLARLVKLIKRLHPAALVVVDNCYGEFVETSEPPAVGADLCAGSLIKNPGGGLVPSGGYVAGRRELVELVAHRLTAPGLGREVGPTFGYLRLMSQGFFLAPHATAQALKGAVFAARLFQRLGYQVLPGYDEPRSDIVQGIALGSREQVLRFCQAIQAASPVDAHVEPVGAPLPGYEAEVVMAAGTFVQGASLELTADAPLREPYAVYLQGGLTKEHALLGILAAARALRRENC